MRRGHIRRATTGRSELQTASATLGAALAAVVLAACTSTVVGTPAAAPGPAPTTSAVVPPPVGVIPAPELTVGTLLEAHRIAAVTSLVQTTFPERTESCFPSGPQLGTGPLEALYFGDKTVAPVLDRYGFVTAWGQCQRTAGMSTLMLVVELSDPVSAGRAAVELTTAAEQKPDQETDVLPVTGIRAVLRGGPDGDTAQAWAPVGRMLAYTFHKAPPGHGLAGADRLMADQTALLATFVPTPQADVPALPTDPHGLQRVTLAPPGELTPLSGPYDLEGYVRLAIDPLREREVLAANGFTGMYAKHSREGSLSYAVNLYAFPTSAQTNVVYTTFADLETAAFSGTPFTLPSIPNAPCFSFSTDFGGGPSYFQRCYVGYGSYLAGIDVSGLTTPDDVAAMDRLLPAQRDLIDG